MNIDKNIQEVPIEDIIPNRFQPRLAFNEEGITELSESIKQHGIIQPLVVRRLGDKFEIIAGERRYKAATTAGLTKVPVIISDIDDNKSAEVALVENIQRRNLTAIEEAKSYKNLLDRGYMTQEQLANKMGVSQSAVANKLRLLNLDEEVQDALLNEKISERHARALLSLENKEDQKKWLKRIVEERLTVRQLDIELKKAEENDGEEVIPLVEINPNLDEIVSNAEDINVERALHDVASMLIPEGGLPTEKEETAGTIKSPNKFFNFLEDEQANMNVIEPDEILNTFTSTPILEEAETKTETELPEKTNLENENKSTSDETKMDFVEVLDELDESVLEVKPDMEPLMENMNFENPTMSSAKEIVENPDEANISIEQNEKEEITEIKPIIEKSFKDENSEDDKPIPIQESDMEKIEPIPIVENSNIFEEVKNTPINSISETPNSIIEEPKTNSILDDSFIVEEPKPFKSIFFTNEDDDSDESIIESPIKNSIMEIEPVVEEPIIDPLDSIVKLEPGYEQRQQELEGRDLKTAINVVREMVSDLERRGFVVESEEADLEDLYHITIKINKNDN